VTVLFGTRDIDESVFSAVTRHVKQQARKRRDQGAAGLEPSGTNCMALNRAWLRLALAVVLMAVPATARAGGVGLTDEENQGDGPAFFGFVREVDGPGIANAKVTAELKGRGALVTRTDILGVYKIPSFGNDINPDDVTISCAKDGYKQESIQRRPRNKDDSKDPVEIECYMQKQ
jgi:hypothetical protein